MRVLDPKSRWAQCRRQLAKTDDPIVIQLLHITMGPLRPDDPLWHMSHSAYRSRWDAVCDELQIPHRRSEQGFTPAGLRGGGVTYLSSVHEDLEYVRGRARWQNAKTGESYLQELGGWHFLNTLDERIASRLQRLSLAAPKVIALVVDGSRSGLSGNDLLNFIQMYKL